MTGCVFLLSLLLFFCLFFLFCCFFFLSFIDIAHTLLFLMSIIPLYLTKQKAHTLRQQVIYEKLLKEYQGEKLVFQIVKYLHLLCEYEFQQIPSIRPYLEPAGTD